MCVHVRMCVCTYIHTEFDLFSELVVSKNVGGKVTIFI